MIDFGISSIDSSILIGYFLIVLLIGYVLARRINTGDDFFLAGRRLHWTVIGFSLFASNISSATIIGLTGQAYVGNISIANYEWMATFVLVFMAIFIVPVYLRNKLITVPQYLELRYNSFARKYYSLVTIILTIIVDIAGSLFAGALVINVFFPSIDVISACYAMALISGIYTAAGGLAAVVYTDVLQAVMLLIGSAIVLFAVLGQFDFSWANAVADIPVEKTSLMQPADDPTLPWIGTIFGLPILGFYYWSTNHYVVQRVLGAKNVAHAQWGNFLGGFLKLSVLFLIVFPGAISLQIFPGIENSNMVYPEMVENLLPPGVKGIVLAGLIAAIMSSVDSALNGTSTLIVIDFINARRPDLAPVQLTKYGRVTTLIVMTIAGLWAPFIGNFEGLFTYLQQILSFAVPPIVCVFLFGFFWKKGSALAAKYTMIFGHLLCFISMILMNLKIIDIHFTIMAAILLLGCCIGYIILSHFYPDEAFPSSSVHWNWKQSIRIEGQPWFVQPITLATALVLLTLIIIFMYW